MGFYKHYISRFEQTAPQGVSLDDRMVAAKSLVEESHLQEINSWKNYLKTASTLPPTSRAFVAEGVGRDAQITAIQTRITNLTRQYDKLSNQTPEEYFAKISLQETKDLKSFAARSLDQHESSFNRMSNYYHGKGLVGFIGEKLGFANKLFQKAQTTEYNDRVVAEAAIQSQHEWANLPTEEKYEYLVGRLEQNGQVAFDAQRLESYAQENAEQVLADNSHTAVSTTEEIQFRVNSNMAANMIENMAAQNQPSMEE